jgi:O-antigen/teichoic acid export membrane protein
VSLTTVISAAIVSPSANAGFYAAWTIANVLYMLPYHLSTVLFAVASADPQSIGRKLRFALLVSFALGLPGMAVLGFGAHIILGLFGPGYARVAARPMLLLVAAYVPVIPKVFYVAVCRALGRIPRAAAVLTTFSALEMSAAVVGGLKGGLVGLSLGLLVVSVIEALVTAPAVARAAGGIGRHRRASAGYAAAGAPASGTPARVVAGADRTGLVVRQLPAASASQARQRAGLNMLLSLSSPGYIAVPLGAADDRDDDRCKSTSGQRD